MSDAPPFEIVGITILTPPRLLDGASVVAEVTVRHGLVELRGSQLLHRDDGAFKILLPRGGRASRVWIGCYRARQDMLAAAVAAYRAIAERPLATAPHFQESDIVRP